MRRIKILVSFNLTDQYIQKVRDMGLDLEIRQSRDEKELLKLVKDVDALFAGFLNREMFLAAKQLKWIQVTSAGVDRFLFPELVESPVILTNSSGVHPTPISEHVLALMLSFTRGLYLLMRKQLEKKWERVSIDELAGKTIGVVGLGSVGSEVARKAKCLGMTVIATKRTLSDKPDYVDELLPPSRLQELFSKSDFVVLTVPLTAETMGMVGESQLRSMKKTAYIINISRGKIIQEDVLIRALKDGWIAGAGLDVFEKEPLTSNSELWNMKNVIITPHMAGATPNYWDRATSIFCENLKRFAHDEPMINVVDKKTGY